MTPVDIIWPGGEHPFFLRLEQLRALQDRCDAGPAYILAALSSGTWLVDHVIQTIRLGLEGGGMESKEAKRLVALHVEDRPIALSVMTAQAVLMHSLYGPEDDPVGESSAAAGKKRTRRRAENGGGASS